VRWLQSREVIERELRELSLCPEPPVLEDFSNLEPLLRILLQHLSEQVFAAGAEVSRVAVCLQVERLIADLVVARLAVVVPEGRLSREQHVKQAAEGPNVTAEAVRFALDNLGSCVAGSSNLEASLVLAAFKLYCAAQIGDTHLCIFTEVGHQDVLDLNISVDDVLGVKAFDTNADLNHNFPRMVLTQRLRRLFH